MNCNAIDSKNTILMRMVFMMVEARGVEPLSEDRQRTGSTCVADSLSFAATHARRLA